MSQSEVLELFGASQGMPQSYVSLMKDLFAEKISRFVKYGTAKCVYSSEYSSSDLNSVQTLLLSLFHALSVEDVVTSVTLIHLSNSLEHFKSKYLVDWLLYDYVFEKDSVKSTLKTFQKIISVHFVEFPSNLLKIFSALALKYFCEEEVQEFAYLFSDEQDTLDARLIDAVGKNNVAEILYLATKGANVELKTPSGGNLYHLAISENHVEAITALRFLKTNTEVFDNNWETPLLKAVNADSYKMVKEMVIHGAKIGRRFKGGNDIFHIASSYGKNKALEALLESGPDVKNINQEGETPLILAVKSKNVTGVKLLLNHGANPNDLLKNGDSVLHLACSLNCVGLVKALVLAGAKLSLKNKEGLIPLHMCQNSEVVKVVNTFQMSLNSKPIYCGDTLHLAVVHSGNEVLMTLLDHGVPIDSTNNKGETPLMVACKLNKTDLALTLINCGADVNIKDKGGYSAVYRTAEYGHLDILKILEAAGGELNVTLNSGSTLLHAAALNGHVHVVDYLLSCEEIQLISKTCRFNIGKHLCGFKESRTWQALHIAAFKGNSSLVQLLLQYGASVNDKDEEKHSSLHIAASEGHLEVTEALLRAGADLNAKCYTGCYPLHHAANNGHLEVVKALLRQGADPNTRDNDGQCPLHKAVSGGHLEVVKCLIEYNADIKSRTVHGYTPLQLTNNAEVKTFLVSKGAT